MTLRPQNPPARAFTLIELLIVILILTIISGGLYGLIAKIGQQRDRLERRADVYEGVSRTLSAWRRDVAFAETVTPAPDGMSMTIARRDQAGEPFTIDYRIDDAGRLVRRRQPALRAVDQVLSLHARDLRFTRQGRGFRIAWRIEFNDGIQNWTWRRSGFATPLAQGARTP